MASKLKAKDPKTAEPSKPKILIFGKSGAGKTWQALDFPKCYYIDTEAGADLEHYTDKIKAAGGKYMGPEDGALDFETVVEQFKGLATENHDFKTVIVDSITKLFNTAVANEADRLAEKNVFGADKKPAIAWMRRLVVAAARVDMNVIFIAHAKSEWGTDEKGNRVEIGQTFDCWDKLEYELHLALEITKQGPARKAKVRKSRLTGFPDGESFKWDYPTFAEKYGKDIMEKEVKPIVLATPEQVAEIERLLSIVKIDEATIAKWNKSANAEAFTDYTTEQAAGVIALLNNKITPTTK